GLNARLTRERPGGQWIVPADGVYRVMWSGGLRATGGLKPAATRIAIDGNPQPPSDTLTLRKRQRLEVTADVMQPTGVMIIPAGETQLFRRVRPGISLDAADPPRTHVPRLW